jgi:hypothetical protein
MSFHETDLPQILGDIHSGRTPMIWREPDGRLLLQPSMRPTGILSGSFDPLHEGHVALRRAAEAVLEGPVCFEITLTNADKPPLDPPTVIRRFGELGRFPLVLTNAPTFADKARLFPDSTFVVGCDTAARILQVRFYGGCADLMRASLETVREAGCCFLVAGRLLGKRFGTVRDLALPREFEYLFRELPEEDFRADVSSTALRGR